MNPGEDFVYLKISLLKLDGSRSNVCVFLSPRLEQVFGNPKGFQIPDYKRDIPVSQYVASVSAIIKNKFDFIVEHYKMKKIFICTFVAICNNSIVEYDTEFFTKVSFLHTSEDYTCLVSIIIGKFSYTEPLTLDILTADCITLSIYHTITNQLLLYFKISSNKIGTGCQSFIIFQ